MRTQTHFCTEICKWVTGRLGRGVVPLVQSCPTITPRRESGYRDTIFRRGASPRARAPFKSECKLARTVGRSAPAVKMSGSTCAKLGNRHNQDRTSLIVVWGGHGSSRKPKDLQPRSFWTRVALSSGHGPKIFSSRSRDGEHCPHARQEVTYRSCTLPIGPLPFKARTPFAG